MEFLLTCLHLSPYQTNSEPTSMPETYCDHASTVYFKKLLVNEVSPLRATTALS